MVEYKLREIEDKLCFAPLNTANTYRVVPENIHTSPTEGIGNSRDRGWESQRPKNLKQCMKLNWNVQRGGGSWGKSLL